MCYRHELSALTSVEPARGTAVIMLAKPYFLSGRRERRKLIPADLGKVERLGKKAFGKKWEAVIGTFDFLAAKQMPKISKCVRRVLERLFVALRLLCERQVHIWRACTPAEGPVDAQRGENKVRGKEALAFRPCARGHPAPMRADTTPCCVNVRRQRPRRSAAKRSRRSSSGCEIRVSSTGRQYIRRSTTFRLPNRSPSQPFKTLLNARRHCWCRSTTQCTEMTATASTTYGNFGKRTTAALYV